LARKILLADDSVTAQNMGRKILADAGYEVITVNNGSAALKKISEVKPDLVILDVYMPGYSGLEVCQRLKETPDSSRIPVLLTVGKLEPFKPEEAKRVRAEAFIVKPFEASELLSMLSKLEDKVVPRSEPSKPGRFARAIASVEESGRGRIQPIDGGDESWRSRISFPNEKPEPEAKVEDDSSIYNPMNRDLRTVVASSAERVEDKKAGTKKDEEKQLPEMAVESGLDVAAVSPPGAPQDVTPEEVAAIAAAAAQIQALQRQLEEEKASAENAAPAASVAEAVAAPEDKVEENLPSVVPPAQSEEASETQDIPMTMAAASDGGSRWTAVSVALDADEANISLEQEMQKVYATFTAEQTLPAEEKAESVAVESCGAPAEPLGQVTAAVSPHEAMQSESASELPAAVMRAEPVAVPEPASAVPQAELQDAIPVTEAVSAAVVPSEVVSEQLTEPASTAKDSSTIEATLEPVAETAPEDTLPAPAEPVVEAAASANQFTSFVSEQISEQMPMQEPPRQETREPASAHEEVENVKSTAAAWANWRQIRDASEPPPAPVPQQESAISAEAASVEAPAAMAVAAGAEKLMKEALQPVSENPGDVASIVDSVLADLRPRLMAEISRKISEKK
jgi:twitching motility two-component system response regulator PilH